MPDTILILDAMGVIYAAADDVEELLIPFVLERSGTADRRTIAESYLRASLGTIDAPAFWTSVGLSPDVEDEYLARHRLSDGLLPFLDTLPASVSAVWCLSNDVAAWSKKLRVRHLSGQRFDGFVISGDVGCRKPDRGIYDHLLERIRRPANDAIFVDDRSRNLDAAGALGFRTLLFAPDTDLPANSCHTVVKSFAELADAI